MMSCPILPLLGTSAKHELLLHAPAHLCEIFPLLNSQIAVPLELEETYDCALDAMMLHHASCKNQVLPIWQFEANSGEFDILKSKFNNSW